MKRKSSLADVAVIADMVICINSDPWIDKMWLFKSYST